MLTNTQQELITWLMSIVPAMYLPPSLRLKNATIALGSLEGVQEIFEDYVTGQSKTGYPFETLSRQEILDIADSRARANDLFAEYAKLSSYEVAIPLTDTPDSARPVTGALTSADAPANPLCLGFADWKVAIEFLRSTNGELHQRNEQKRQARIIELERELAELKAVNND